MHHMENDTIHLFGDDAIYTAVPSVPRQQLLIDLKWLTATQVKQKACCFLENRSTEMNITSLNGTPTKRASSYKYLGFWLDDELCFKNILMN